jgi:hypothetical protein
MTLLYGVRLRRTTRCWWPEPDACLQVVEPDRPERDGQRSQRRAIVPIAATSNALPPQTSTVHDVDALDAAQQAAFMAALAHIPRQGADACRIITTTAVWLFDRVLQRSFNAALFDRLNTIHIRLDAGPAAGRRPTATIGQSAARM